VFARAHFETLVAVHRVVRPESAPRRLSEEPSPCCRCSPFGGPSVSNCVRLGEPTLRRGPSRASSSQSLANTRATRGRGERIFVSQTPERALPVRLQQRWDNSSEAWSPQERVRWSPICVDQARLPDVSCVRGARDDDHHSIGRDPAGCVGARIRGESRRDDRERDETRRCAGGCVRLRQGRADRLREGVRPGECRQERPRRSREDDLADRIDLEDVHCDRGHAARRAQPAPPPGGRRLVSRR